MYQTNDYEGMQAETVTMQGHKGDTINAYYARPLGEGPHPGMVIIHHAPGWDEWYRECARRFAHHGYATISPNLYFRDGHGTPEDVGNVVELLCSEKAGWITGQVIYADGGASLMNPEIPTEIQIG